MEKSAARMGLNLPRGPDPRSYNPALAMTAEADRSMMGMQMQPDPLTLRTGQNLFEGVCFDFVPLYFLQHPVSHSHFNKQCSCGVHPKRCDHLGILRTPISAECLLGGLDSCRVSLLLA